MNLSQKIESYLFYVGEAVAIKKLAKVFDVSEKVIQDALNELEEVLKGRGIVLMKNGDEVMLATHPEMGDLIISIKKQELSDPLSKAALETLAIILYKDGATKSEIDFIRGVNSGYILRNLSIRGLVEKNQQQYRPTFDTLRFLGITTPEALPHFQEFKEEMSKREEVVKE